MNQTTSFGPPEPLFQHLVLRRGCRIGTMRGQMKRSYNSGTCTTDYVLRSALYNARQRERERNRVRCNAPEVNIHVESSGEWAKRECPGGCGRLHLLKPGELCPWCTPETEFGITARSIRFSIDAGPEDSTNSVRIANGTAGYNMALPGVVEEYGPKNAYGQRTVLKKRPVHNNEVPTTRSLKERGKRAGMTLQEAPKRALPE